LVFQKYLNEAQYEVRAKNMRHLEKESLGLRDN